MSNKGLTPVTLGAVLVFIMGFFCGVFSFFEIASQHALKISLSLVFAFWVFIIYRFIVITNSQVGSRVGPSSIEKGVILFVLLIGLFIFDFICKHNFLFELILFKADDAA